jgi:hypothetical protein
VHGSSICPCAPEALALRVGALSKTAHEVPIGHASSRIKVAKCLRCPTLPQVRGSKRTRAVDLSRHRPQCGSIHHGRPESCPVAQLWSDQTAVMATCSHPCPRSSRPLGPKQCPQ